jgi:hypothetical protein
VSEQIVRCCWDERTWDVPRMALRALHARHFGDPGFLL